MLLPRLESTFTGKASRTPLKITQQPQSTSPAVPTPSRFAFPNLINFFENASPNELDNPNPQKQYIQDRGKPPPLFRNRQAQTTLPTAFLRPLQAPRRVAYRGSRTIIRYTAIKKVKGGESGPLSRHTQAKLCKKGGSFGFLASLNSY